MARKAGMWRFTASLPEHNVIDQLLTHHVQEHKKVLGDKFELVTAFSREGPTKVYVQHRLKERAKEINELLLKKGYIYICGDAANMAREVHSTLIQIVAEQRGVSNEKAEEVIKAMRSANQYQVRFSSAAITSQPESREGGYYPMSPCAFAANI